MTTPEAPHLSEQVALITGANHGIGAATALALANMGADVAVTCLRLDLADEDPGRPGAYAIDRGRDANKVVKLCRGPGGPRHLNRGQPQGRDCAQDDSRPCRG